MNLDEAIAQLTEITGPLTSEMVACGVVVATWRDALEPLHGNLADHEMAYSNIAATVAVAPVCTVESVDWGAVHRTLLDPGREALPDRTAHEVAAGHWQYLHDALRDRLADAQRRPAIAHAAWAAMMCDGWWGMPGYSEQVAALLRTGRVTRWEGTSDELGEALVSDPLSVPLAVWEQIAGGNWYGWLDR